MCCRCNSECACVCAGTLWNVLPSKVNHYAAYMLFYMCLHVCVYVCFLWYHRLDREVICHQNSTVCDARAISFNSNASLDSKCFKCCSSKARRCGESHETALNTYVHTHTRTHTLTHVHTTVWTECFLGFHEMLASICCYCYCLFLNARNSFKTRFPVLSNGLCRSTAVMFVRIC